MSVSVFLKQIRKQSSNMPSILKLYNKYDWLHSVRSTLTIGALVIAVFSAFLLDSPAHSAAITLGTAANYGVLVGSGQTLALNGGGNIARNVGLGSRRR